CPIARPLGENVPATSANSTAPRTCTRVSRSLLAIHFLCTACHLGTALRLGSAQPLVGLVGYDGIVQQLLANARRQLGGIDFVLSHRFASLIVNRQARHDSLLSSGASRADGLVWPKACLL